MPSIRLVISALLFLVWSGAIASDPAATAKPETPKALFFLSFECNACRTVFPQLESLHSDGKVLIEGRVYGTPSSELVAKAKAAKLSFPLSVGYKAQRIHYGVRATPTIILLNAGRQPRERFSGVNGVERFVAMIREGRAASDVGVLELTRTPRAFADKPVHVSGLLRNTGKDYFKSPHFVLTNGTESIDVEPWLPLSVAPRPRELQGKPEPPTMAAFIGHYVRVQGTVKLAHDRPVIVARSGEILP